MRRYVAILLFTSLGMMAAELAWFLAVGPIDLRIAVVPLALQVIACVLDFTRPA